MQTTIQKWGNSQAIRLPKPIMDLLLLKESDLVTISTYNDSIIIKKATRKRRANKSLKERFEGYNGTHVCEELSWGQPVKGEIDWGSL